MARKIQDTGEKIGGARKDFARNSLNLEDLNSFTEVEIVSHVTKDNIWPQPDYDKMVENGVEPKAAALIKIVRSKIASKPVFTTTSSYFDSAMRYLDVLTIAKEYYNSCKTATAVENGYAILLEKIGKKNTDIHFYNNEGRKLLQALQSQRARSYPLYINSNDYNKAYMMLKEGFASKVEPHLKGFRILEHGSFYIAKGKKVVKTGLATKEDAEKWLKERYEAKPEKKEKKEVPERPHLDHISRKGLTDWRQGRNIDPQEFITHFGFRAVEFGNWLPDDERQTVLNMGFDALMDMAEILEIDPKEISLGNSLAAAFGSRGRKGAAAHYEPDRNVINLTRMSGAGALAHEWGHALDRFLGKDTTAKMLIGYMTGGREKPTETVERILSHQPEDIAKAASDLMSTIYSKPKPVEEVIEVLDKRIQEWLRAENSHKAILEKEQQKENPSKRIIRQYTKNYIEHQKHRMSIEKRKEELIASEVTTYGHKDSDFYANSKKMVVKPGYWERPTELFARAFESYVFDKLAEQGLHNDYLVAHTENRVYPEEIYGARPYPEGEERTAIIEKMDKLTKSLHQIWDSKPSLSL